MTTHNNQIRPPIRVLTRQGIQFLPNLTDQEASQVGRHWNAVRRYLEYGDETGLTHLDGLTVGGFTLETDPYAIEWFAMRGEVRFESIYDEVT